MRKLWRVLLAMWFAAPCAANAQTLNGEMAALADKLSKALVEKGFKSVAAVDFTDLQGQSTELGRFLAERLTVEIVSTGGVSMVDRANIKSILAEHKLTEEGLVNPANAKKLGEFAGVDAILIGNATALDSGIELLVKAVATESSKLVAAGRITFPKTSEIQQLLNRSISASPAAFKPGATGSGTTYQDAVAIATKDIGSLRVVLKSVLPFKTDRGGAGIRCSFDFISLETQRSVVVALNAMPGTNWKPTPATYRAYGGGDPGPPAPPDPQDKLSGLLRSTLVDDSGGTWSLPNSSVVGIGVVGVGRESAYGPYYDPSQITSVLSKRDDRNSDEGIDRQFNTRYRFMFGSPTEISPGQTLTVTMSFVRDENRSTSDHPTRAFQLGTEVVIGVPKKGETRSYSLHNLVFDRVTLPEGKQ